MIVRVILEGAEAIDYLRAHAAAEVKPPPSKRRGPLTSEELEARILAVLPADNGPDAYTRADLPRPWYRAGRALSRLRTRGLVIYDRGYRKAVTS